MIFIYTFNIIFYYIKNKYLILQDWHYVLKKLYDQ